MTTVLKQRRPVVERPPRIIDLSPSKSGQALAAQSGAETERPVPGDPRLGSASERFQKSSASAPFSFKGAVRVDSKPVAGQRSLHRESGLRPALLLVVQGGRLAGINRDACSARASKSVWGSTRPRYPLDRQPETKPMPRVLNDSAPRSRRS